MMKQMAHCSLSSCPDLMLFKYHKCYTTYIYAVVYLIINHAINFLAHPSVFPPLLSFPVLGKTVDGLSAKVGYLNLHQWNQCNFKDDKSFDNVTHKLVSVKGNIGDYVDFLLQIPQVQHLFCVQEC
jgi:hypothetical protein